MYCLITKWDFIMDECLKLVVRLQSLSQNGLAYVNVNTFLDNNGNFNFGHFLVF